MARFPDKAAIVTGASAGVGLASVVLVARGADRLAADKVRPVGAPDVLVSACDATDECSTSHEAHFAQGASIVVDGGRTCHL